MSAKHSVLEDKLSDVYICSACSRTFELRATGGLYGLHPKDFDDVFFTILCNHCTHIIKANSDDPERLALKQRLEEYFRDAESHPLHGSIALTSLKTLEFHFGDIAKALEIGWPFPKAMHHYDLVTPHGAGIVMVAEKESGHDA
jgi:hypothetical protein